MAKKAQTGGDTLGDIAASLGSLLGNAEKQWRAWQGPRDAVVQAVTDVRDRAVALLSEMDVTGSKKSKKDKKRAKKADKKKAEKAAKTDKASQPAKADKPGKKAEKAGKKAEKAGKKKDKADKKAGKKAKADAAADVSPA